MLSNGSLAALRVPLLGTRRQPIDILYVAEGKALLTIYRLQCRAKMTWPSPNSRTNAFRLLTAESDNLTKFDVGLHHVVRDIAHLIQVDRCFHYFDAALPPDYSWEQASNFRSNYGRRMANKCKLFDWMTFVSVIVTKQGQPLAMRVFIPDDLENQIQIFQDNAQFGTTQPVELSDELDALHMARTLYADLEDTPINYRRFEARRGIRPPYYEVEVEDVNHATSILEHCFARLKKVEVTLGENGRVRFTFKPRIDDRD